MHKSITKVVSIVAVAAVVVLGIDHASNATAPAPIRNVAHVYTVATTGGTGEALFNVPIPSEGTWQASYTANFYPQGTPAVPVSFSCYLLRDGAMLTQSTTVGTYTAGF